jgi:hypothetical protein
MIAEACKRLAIPEPTILEEPPSTSGKIPFARRPQGNFLLRVLREGDVLVVVRVDRLGRSIMDIFGTVQILSDRGVRVLILRGWGNQAIDLERATDRIFLLLLAWMAETERNLIAERTRDGLAHRRLNGLATGRRVFTRIQCYDAEGKEIPPGEFRKMAGHFKRNCFDTQWLDQLCQLLMLQKAIGARGRVLLDYCRERKFVNRDGKEWWRGTLHVNGNGSTYMNQLSKYLKLVRRMAVLGKLPEKYCTRVLTITKDTPAVMQPKWKKVQAAAAPAAPSEADMESWDADQLRAWIRQSQSIAGTA